MGGRTPSGAPYAPPDETSEKPCGGRHASVHLDHQHRGSTRIDRRHLGRGRAPRRNRIGSLDDGCAHDAECNQSGAA